MARPPWVVGYWRNWLARRGASANAGASPPDHAYPAAGAGESDPVVARGGAKDLMATMRGPSVEIGALAGRDESAGAEAGTVEEDQP